LIVSKARFCDKAPNPAIPEEKDVMEEMIAALEVETRQAMVILTLVSQDKIKHHEQLYKRDLSGYAEESRIGFPATRTENKRNVVIFVLEAAPARYFGSVFR